MATNATHSLIASTGGDYSTVQAWEDDIGVGLGTSLDMVTDDYDHYGWLAAEEFVENISISGQTTDTTHKIYLAADSNGATCPASGHSQTKTDAALMDDDTRALAYNTSYAALKSSTSWAYGLQESAGNCEFSRIQFYKSGVNAYGFSISASSFYSRCYFKQYSSGGGFGGGVGSKMYASLVENIGSNAVRSAFNEVNCTTVHSSISSIAVTGRVKDVQYARPSYENSAYFSRGAGTEAIHTLGGGGFSTLDYNATDHSDLTSKTGEGANNVYSLTASNQFVALDSTDWSLKVGNDLDAGGTDKTSIVPLDIWGNSFSVGDIGCEASAALIASCTLSGTATASITEDDITTGGKTIILTLTNDTWLTAGAPFDATRQSIIDGLVSAQSEATGWNNSRSGIAVTDVARTSDTVCTITLPAL